MHKPSPWIERHLGGVRPGGKVLDVACGAGRHMRIALDHGFEVTGVDRDTSAAAAAGLATEPRVSLVTADLEGGRPWLFPPGSFDGVIVTNYLWRPILPAIVATVAADGVLLYETFRVGNERHGRPSRREFLLEPGELLDAVAGRLIPVTYEDMTLADPPRCVQRLCAVGRDHPWITAPPLLP